MSDPKLLENFFIKVQRKAVFFCLKPCTLNATSSVSSSSKCTKIVSDWGFAPDPTEAPTALPQTSIAGLMGLISKRGRRAKGEGDEGGEGREGDGRGGERKRGTLDPHKVGNRLTPLQ